jgi:hypothetical protein
MDVTVSPASVELADPPPEARHVMKLAAFGAAGVALAGLLGLVGMSLAEPSPWLAGARVIAVVLGGVVIGHALSLRPLLTHDYLIAAAAAFAAIYAIPESWDSLRIVARVLTGLALFGALVTVLPRRAWVAVISGLALLHFSGILTAVFGPPPTPWLVTQTWTRGSRPYLQFMYLNNAYQFYSPDPGPASIFWACIHYEKPDAHGKRTEWVKLPQRPQHLRDPLALTYFRRLSLVEMTAMMAQPANFGSGGNPGALSGEARDVLERRKAAAVEVPFIPAWPLELQCRIPPAAVVKDVIPSYARHIMRELRDPGRTPKFVRLFRVEHRIINPHEMVGYEAGEWNEEKKLDPMDPRTFLPYYYGQFDAEGRLMNSKDPLLYWVVPILVRPDVTATGVKGDVVNYATKYGEKE